MFSKTQPNKDTLCRSSFSATLVECYNMSYIYATVLVLVLVLVHACKQYCEFRKGKRQKHIRIAASTLI